MSPRALRALLWCVLAVAMVASFAAEWHLATAHGWNEYTAATIPLMVDLTTVAAVGAGKYVGPVMLVAIVLNVGAHAAGSHLDVATGFTWLLAALPPVAVLTTHRLQAHTQATGAPTVALARNPAQVPTQAHGVAEIDSTGFVSLPAADATPPEPVAITPEPLPVKLPEPEARAVIAASVASKDGKSARTLATETGWSRPWVTRAMTAA